ncbi:hypothetical protein QA584_10085 [Anaerocolumna sp. AGMB13025]|uniref:hypothetical protein n=1 Tax=Anaerocolumna sp. AGMB13025 TaxID=3039116 RepID=UPI00241CA3A9|nr:hypothetical protein [Anaerocolumna sp. AGMB13025]WFR59413.1 hypothetical protein QA584_10085 [Anaerocolumna sp. AGMB13025]
MNQKEDNSNIKITTTTNNTIQEQIKSKDEKDLIKGASAIVPRAGYYPQNECNPDNGAFFEERSNPLSSKGN